ncbi:MAG: hypothetical protein JXQ66_03365, partial [Campylobacterales bacterium]|nr:hypothetical protein [Campylobacterales bacterium]
MKHFVFKSDDKKELKKAQNEALRSCYKSVLVQIFSSLEDEIKLSKLVKKITKKFPRAIVLGSTTAGEISNAKIYDGTTVISVSYFENTTLKAAYTKDTDKKSGSKIASKIYKEDTKAIVVLSEGLKGSDYEGFINSFNEKNPDVIVAGGLSGDNFKLQKTYVFLDGTIYDRGSVAVSFSSKNLYADYRYNLNWIPIGKEFTITKAEKNILYEIDGENSVEIFKRYLGAQIFENNAKGLPYFQLLYKDGLTVVARTPLAVDNGTLVMAGPISEGQKVQF